MRFRSYGMGGVSIWKKKTGIIIIIIIIIEGRTSEPMKVIKKVKGKGKIMLRLKKGFLDAYSWDGGDHVTM